MITRARKSNEASETAKNKKPRGSLSAISLSPVLSSLDSTDWRGTARILPAKFNEKKNKGEFFLLEKQHENLIVAAVTKWEMLAATNAMWKWAAVKNYNYLLQYFIFCLNKL